MTTTRDQVLHTLLAYPRRTINELAEAVGINPISVRHHISSLEAEDLVTSEEEHHGVGRPRRVYFLTEAGLEKFPTRYVRLTTRLLEQMKEALPAPMVKQLFTKMAEGLAEDFSASTELNNLPIEKRLDVMKQLLSREGFNIQWEEQGDQYLIHEKSCPYYRVGQDHPEVCSVDQTLISAMLAVPASKIHCILNGDQNCTYAIPNPTPMETKA